MSPFMNPTTNTVYAPNQRLMETNNPKVELDQSFHYLGAMITPSHTPTPASSALFLTEDDENVFQMLARIPIRSNSFPDIGHDFSAQSSRNLASSTALVPPINVSTTLVNAMEDHAASTSIQRTPLSKYADTLEVLQTYRWTELKSTTKPVLADLRNGVRAGLMKGKRAIKDLCHEKQKALQFKLAAGKAMLNFGTDRTILQYPNAPDESDEEACPLIRM